MPIFSAGTSTPIIPLQAAPANGDCVTPTNVIPVESEAPPGVAHLALMLTRRCNMSCGHCSVESGPKIKGEPSDDELLAAVRAAHASGVRSILLTGGEPMLREALALQLLRECRELGLQTAMASNGFWGKTPERARDTIAKLQRAGLGLLTVSYDRYHADYQGPEPTVNIARAANEARLLFNISITRTANETDLDAIVAPFEAVPRARLRFYDVQPIGRARDFEVENLRGEIEGFCNACAAPALTDDGRLTACNGPSYFSAAESPLIVGNLGDDSMDVLLRRHREDSVLEAIRTHGPAWLLAELQTLPGFENWARPAYGGMCDVCLHLNSDPNVTAALRAHLDSPKLVAERAARRLVIEAARQGELRRDEINRAGAARLWWDALRDPTTLREAGADAILGRADLDWSAQQLYLSQCGLAGPLLPALNEPEIGRFAPQFWLDKMRVQAMADAMRALAQRDAMREIAQVAREVGARGVLLKGGALLALNEETTGDLPPRACCDIDVYFEPKVAARVHAALIERGFVAERDELGVEAAQRHQLPGLLRDCVSIEIHQTLLPQFCGAPERAMIRSARPLRAFELRGLRVLAPEALILHSVLHCSKHLWTHGLKAAYDIAWICGRTRVNWRYLARLVARTGMKRGFWTPLILLERALELPIPAWFLKLAPQDRRQKKLERVARRHLFEATRAEFQDNPWICHPLYLLQSDNWLHRARHLADLSFGAYAVQMRAQRARENAGHRAARWVKLKRAARAWRAL